MRKRMARHLAGGLAGLFFALAVMGQTTDEALSMVYATEESGTNTQETQTEENKEESVSENAIKYIERSSDRVITDEDRFDADEDLLYYMQSLEVRYHLDEKVMEQLHKVFDSAVYYIANTEMSLTEMWAYVSSVKSSMESAAVEKVNQTTSEFLQVGDNWQTPIVSYGQGVSIVLPVVNFGTEELNDLIVEPVTSTLVTEWPFEPDMTNYLQTEPYIPGCQTKEQAMANRREFTFHFKTRSDVMSGYYPLKFHISYTKAGIRCEEPAELTVYVKTIGKPGSGIIGGNGQEASGSKPRIVVTGFETNPAKVYAGETFTLTIHVQNTANDTAVTNVLFDMQAAQEGEDKTNTYSAFLPTSGSSSVYMEKIAPDTSADIVIEMTAKADLAQKPYVLDVNMKYDAGTVFDLTDKASVSIPILQESRFDTSIPEVVPDTIDVGSQSNVMMSIYNTGKTTLYNVQVKFLADSIDEASAFVGNLQSGNTGNVDVMLTGAAPTMDDGVVKLEISYEDDAGNVTTAEKEITLFVMEPMMDDMMMGDDMMGGDMMEGEEGGKPKTGLIVSIVVAVIVVAAAGLTAFVKIRKKKKAQAAEAAELAELEKELNE